ncbi:probable CCR4-associated factor 1 homolog 11 [Actinidia eriantha]|uniref:probable CCR4-associated factor 1 homolog 11 n=1 Tax=Actinidia eriantha TaxID=165200 RepID=UPI00258E71CB|nr:probable CCR4-associated factor 1 homolog 11 [Actinidia eriantha]
MEYYCSRKKPVIVRQVWAWNLQQEMALIQHVLPYYRFASMDTEFPGVIFRPRTEKHQYSHFSPTFNYRTMKANVDALKLIQVGLTFSDAYGNLPDLGTHYAHAWEFNFRDFDIDSDRQNPESITLLKNQGIDFKKNRDEALDSERFASQPPMFMQLVRIYFGGFVLDLKHMMKFCDGLCGGLEKLAKALNVDRVAGKSHQAGPDSLLTMQTFLRLRDRYFHGDGNQELAPFQSVLYGLELQRMGLSQDTGRFISGFN